jgi:hypothetical protein
VRSHGERESEVRLVLCFLLVSAVTSRGPVVLQGPLAGALITVWVKRMDVAGARYVAVKGVDVLETVDDFIARWVAQEQLDVRPSLVTLRRVKRGAGKPTAKQEANANVLDDPSLSLAQVKVTNTSWVLAFVAGTQASGERLAMSVSTPGASLLHALASASSRTLLVHVVPLQVCVWQTMPGSKRAQSTRTYSTWVHAAQARARSSWMQIVRSRRRCCAGSKRFAASGLA